MISAALSPLIFDWLVYPGLAWLVVLVLVVGRIAGGPGSGGQALRGMLAALFGRASAARAIAVICGTLALLTLPWPGLPGQTSWQARPWAMWALIEASAVLSLLPGLMAGPVASRAAVREFQLGISARLPLWLAVSALLLARPGDAPQPAVLLLVLIVGLLALPAAGGWAFFDGQAVAGAGALWSLLSEMEAALMHLYWRVRTIFWLALLATVLAPIPRTGDWIELLLRSGVIVAGAMLVRGGRGTLVVVPLPVALRWCWWVALPCAVAAVVLR